MAINDIDSTNLLEKKGQVLEFYQTFSGASVSFKAFLKNYNETFSSQWSGTRVFGRPDPIQNFQGTSRNLGLSWILPAFSLDDAKANLVKTSTLARMLYPEYSKIDNASTMSKGPLIKIKFANLIYDASRGPSGDVRTCGLLGVIRSFTWTPVIDDGFFDPDNQLFPKNITLSINFDVLHQHTLGWEKAEAVQLSENRRSGEERSRDVSKINDRRTTNASNAAPSWGADAALFPWSAGLQRANTIIGTNTVSSGDADEHPQQGADVDGVLDNGGE
tara:strand:+ start:285 stop:1109 length:825 start_codon:yes stop_codon:yes gene_type:complete